jgi:hypothetical protein
MRRLLPILLLPCALAAGERWLKFVSGPVEVFTDAGVRAGRETLVRFEQFRHALGEMVGEQDLAARQPLRVFVFHDARGWSSPEPVTEARDRYAVVLAEKAAVPVAVYAALTRLFLESNTGRMPAAFERGLVEFFSTFQVNGIRITAGTPPPNPGLDWARVHLLATDPEFYGRLRVLLFNLRRGVAEDAAYHNAFGRTAADIDAQARRHLAAGGFQPTALSSRPMAPTDFPERPVSDADARLARADLLAGARSAAEYQALIKEGLKIPEAEEGLGLLALREDKKDDARRHFEAATKAGSTSARCYIEYARLEPDNEKAAQALLKAAGINPKLDEPFALLAARDTDPARRMAHWKAAAERAPRNPAYWQALAETALAEHNYTEAARAWTAGEQAAADPTERERMHRARLAVEQQRLDYEAAERKRHADEEAQEIAKLKDQARAEVHQLEQKYSTGGGRREGGEPVPWWDGPQPPGHVRGTLKQVDCIGKQARLVIQGDDGKSVRLLVRDPAAIAVSGAGELALGCGAQKPRRISVNYFPRANARLGTSGEAAVIEFQ